MTENIKIEQLVVRSDRVIAVVRVNPAHPRTTPEIAAQVARAFPDVLNHACMNAKGPAFAHVIEGTSLAHLLEHLVIDIQASEYTRTYGESFCKTGGSHDKGCCEFESTQEDAQKPPLLKGTTQWIDEDAGIAQVQVSMVSDLFAIRALTQACNYINSLSAHI